MENIKIDPFHLEDIKNEHHPSIFTKSDGYDLFILRTAIQEKGRIVPISNAFIFTEESYYYFDKNESKFINLKDTQSLHKMLDKKIDTMLKITTDFFNTLESIEDKFYEDGNIQGFNRVWFSYKNELIKLNRILFKDIEALKGFITSYKKEDDFLETNFSDLLEHLERSHRNSSHALEKLDTLYNLYITNSNERMNQTIYFLTLLSAIFLPLNLMVGFFGMNTTSMPFTKAEGGTYSVVMLLAAFALISSILALFLKKRKN